MTKPAEAKMEMSRNKHKEVASDGGNDKPERLSLGPKACKIQGSDSQDHHTKYIYYLRSKKRIEALYT